MWDVKKRKSSLLEKRGWESSENNQSFSVSPDFMSLSSFTPTVLNQTPWLKKKEPSLQICFLARNVGPGMGKMSIGLCHNKQSAVASLASCQHRTFSLSQLHILSFSVRPKKAMRSADWECQTSKRGLKVCWIMGSLVGFIQHTLTHNLASHTLTHNLASYILVYCPNPPSVIYGTVRCA